MPEAHFHHLHLNSVDPQAAIDFYPAKFDCERAKFAGSMDGVWAQRSWILFDKVDSPPVSDLTSAIWHFGWGAEDMKATYEKQLAMGTRFSTPLTDISDIGGNSSATGLFYYAYVQGPDNALIELNTARHHQFGHIHLFSADPPAAGQWYMKYFGARGRISPSREPRIYRGVQIGPSASLISDNVNIIIYPVEFAKKAYADQWRGKTEFESTRGHVVDHIGYSFENLAEALEKMRRDGVKVTDEIRSTADGKIKSAFIEGPDKIRIELIEGHAAAPASQENRPAGEATATGQPQQRPVVPQPQQKQSIDYFVGRWSYKYIGRESALGPAPRECTVTFTKNSGGKSIEGVTECKHDGGAYRETSLMVFNESTKTLTFTEKLGSGATLQSRGDWTSPISIRFAIDQVNVKGQTLQLRRTISIVSAHSFTMAEELSENGEVFVRLGNAVFTKAGAK